MALSSRQWQRWWRLAPSSSEDGLLPAVARMVAYKLVASWYGFEWVDVDIVKIAGSDTKELYFCQEVVKKDKKKKDVPSTSWVKHMDADKAGAGHKGSDDGPNRDDDVVIESEAEEELDKKNETDDEEFRADSDGDDQGDGLSNSDRTSDAHSVGGESEGFHTEEEDPPILKDPLDNVEQDPRGNVWKLDAAGARTDELVGVVQHLPTEGTIAVKCKAHSHPINSDRQPHAPRPTWVRCVGALRGCFLWVRRVGASCGCVVWVRCVGTLCVRVVCSRCVCALCTRARHACVHFTHAYIHTYTHACMYTHASVQSFIHTFARAHVRTRIHAYTRARIVAHTLCATHTHAHTHTCMHARTATHT